MTKTYQDILEKRIRKLRQAIMRDPEFLLSVTYSGDNSRIDRMTDMIGAIKKKLAPAWQADRDRLVDNSAISATYGY